MWYFADMHSHFLINGHYLRRDFFGKHSPPKVYNPLKNFLDYEKAWEGGLRILTFTVYVPPSPFFWVSRSEAALAVIRTFKGIVSRSKGRLRQARSASEARSIVDQGSMAAILAAEGGHILDGKLEYLDVFWKAGMRMLTLTHFITNRIADSCYDPIKPHDGLSAFGREVVHRMNDLGMVVDVSHASDVAVRDVLDESRAPVIASHSGMRALHPSPRNLSDELLKEIANRGGMAGIILWPPLLKRHSLTCDLDDWADHVVHAAEVAGPEAVGIGTDLDGYTWPPRGFRDARDYRRLAEVLSKRGFSDEELEKVLGGNYLRVLKTVEEAAR